MVGCDATWGEPLWLVACDVVMSLSFHVACTSSDAM